MLATGTTSSCIWEVERSPGKCARAGLSQCGQERTERQMWGRSCTANWPEPKTSTHEKIFKPLWWMDSKWSTADVRLFKDVGGQGKKVQRANKDTETKISCEEGKHTAGKLFILSVR